MTTIFYCALKIHVTKSSLVKCKTILEFNACGILNMKYINVEMAHNIKGAIFEMAWPSKI